MIVTCTACKTRYLADPARIGPSGRMVRCAKCGHSWMQSPPPDMPLQLDVVPPPLPGQEPSPRFNLPAPYVAPRRRRYRLALAAAAALVLLLGAGYFGRDRIIATWPPAKQVYDAIGGMLGQPTSTLNVQGSAFADLGG